VIIDANALDMDAETFSTRLLATGISTYQFVELTDITRPRLRRVCEGDQKSLVERNGKFYVPRHFTVILLALEAGLLIKGEESSL
jgi:hypothetical protein